jgi:hypothetical protein
MSYPANTYINQLKLLQADLSIVLEGWPSDTSFGTAKELAETIAFLVSRVLMQLQRTPEGLNHIRLIELRSKLERLSELMKDKDKPKFSEYIAMVDSLFNEGVS